MGNMTSWEMNNKAKELLAKKLHKNDVEVEENVSNKYGSYAEEKSKGNVQGMLSHKLANSQAHKGGRYALAKEYMGLPITEIQNRLKTANYDLEATRNYVHDYIEREEKKAYKEIKAISGVSETAIQNHVYRHMENFKKTDAKAIEFMSTLAQDEKEYNALLLAKANYLTENEALIQAEKDRIHREQLLSSGILEELGIITPVEEVDPEEEEQEEAK